MFRIEEKNADIVACICADRYPDLLKTGKPTSPKPRLVVKSMVRGNPVILWVWTFKVGSDYKTFKLFERSDKVSLTDGKYENKGSFIVPWIYEYFGNKRSKYSISIFQDTKRGMVTKSNYV